MGTYTGTDTPQAKRTKLASQTQVRSSSPHGWCGGLNSSWRIRSVAAQVSNSTAAPTVVSVWYPLHLKHCQMHQEVAEGRSVASVTYYQRDIYKALLFWKRTCLTVQPLTRFHEEDDERMQDTAVPASLNHSLHRYCDDPRPFGGPCGGL